VKNGIKILEGVHPAVKLCLDVYIGKTRESDASMRLVRDKGAIQDALILLDIWAAGRCSYTLKLRSVYARQLDARGGEVTF
jgi:hypothetical protein